MLFQNTDPACSGISTENSCFSQSRAGKGHVAEPKKLLSRADSRHSTLGLSLGNPLIMIAPKVLSQEAVSFMSSLRITRP